jgi:acetyl esterase/lipase
MELRLFMFSVLAFLAHSATFLPVTMTYQYESNSMKIAGLAPAGATSGLPVFVWLAGTGDYFETPVDVTRLEAMAARGFISVQIEYPNTLSELLCIILGGNVKIFLEMVNKKAGKVFPAALDALCKHPRADCTAGVAVSGHSQGGFLSLLGLQYANKRVTAVMPLGVGTPDIPELMNNELSKYLAKGKQEVMMS